MKLIQFGLIVLSLVPCLATLLLGYQTMRAGFKLMGRPSIGAPFFYAAKAGIGFVFAFLLTAAVVPGFFLKFPLLLQTEIAEVQKLLALVFLLAGNLLLLPAYFTMSIFTRVGLPTSEHVLQTSGVYRISRNPMYTSFLFFFPACFLLIPSLVLALLMAFILIAHHFIIRNEEAYLESAFGEQYRVYKSGVARYL